MIILSIYTCKESLIYVVTQAHAVYTLILLLEHKKDRSYRVNVTQISLSALPAISVLSWVRYTPNFRYFEQALQSSRQEDETIELDRSQTICKAWTANKVSIHSLRWIISWLLPLRLENWLGFINWHFHPVAKLGRSSIGGKGVLVTQRYRNGHVFVWELSQSTQLQQPESAWTATLTYIIDLYIVLKKTLDLTLSPAQRSANFPVFCRVAQNHSRWNL